MSQQLKAPLTDSDFITVWNQAPSLARFCELTGYSQQQATSKASQLRAAFKRVVVPCPDGTLDETGAIKLVPKYPDPSKIIKKHSPSGRKAKDMDVLAQIGEASIQAAESVVKPKNVA